MKFLFSIKRWLVVLVLFLSASNYLPAQTYALESPNKELKLTVNIGEQVSFTVANKGSHVLKVPRIALELERGNVLGKQPKLVKKKLELIEETITVPVPHKDANIKSVCSQ